MSTTNDDIAQNMNSNVQELPDTFSGLSLNNHSHEEPTVVASINSKLKQAKGTSLDSLPAEITE